MQSSGWVASATQEALNLLEAYIDIEEEPETHIYRSLPWSLNVITTSSNSGDEPNDTPYRSSKKHLWIPRVLTAGLPDQSEDPCRHLPFFQDTETARTQRPPFCEKSTPLVRPDLINILRFPEPFGTPTSPYGNEMQMEPPVTQPADDNHPDFTDSVDEPARTCRGGESALSMSSSVGPRSSHISEQFSSRTPSRFLPSRNLLPEVMDRTNLSPYGDTERSLPDTYERCVSVPSVPVETRLRLTSPDSASVQLNSDPKRKQIRLGRFKRWVGFRRRANLLFDNKQTEAGWKSSGSTNRAKSSRGPIAGLLGLLTRQPTLPHLSGGLYVRKPLFSRLRRKQRLFQRKGHGHPGNGNCLAQSKLYDPGIPPNGCAPHEVIRVYRELIQTAEGARLLTSTTTVWDELEVLQKDGSGTSEDHVFIRPEPTHGATRINSQCPIRPNNLPIDLIKEVNNTAWSNLLSSESSVASHASPSPLQHSLPSSRPCQPEPGNQSNIDGISSPGILTTTSSNPTRTDSVPYTIVANMINILSQRIMNQITEEEMERRLRAWEERAEAYENERCVSSDPATKSVDGLLQSRKLKRSLLAHAKRLEHRQQLEIDADFLDLLIARIDYAAFESDILQLLGRRASWHHISVLYYLARCAVRRLLQAHFHRLDSIEQSCNAMDQMANSVQSPPAHASVCSEANSQLSTDALSESFRQLSLTEMGRCRASVGRIKDFTVRFFLRWYADWVHKRGGWQAVIDETDDSELD